MADLADRAEGLADSEVSENVRKVVESARTIPKGRPGDCDICGYWSGRLVGGACAPCRDKYKLK